MGSKKVSVRVNMEPELVRMLQWLKHKYSVQITSVVCAGLAGRVLDAVRRVEGLPPNYGQEWIKDPDRDEMKALREMVELEGGAG